MNTPRLAWYGDDFTGATDTLATAAQAGLRSLLFLGVPSAAHLQAAGPLDAIGIAGAARAMDPQAMAAELEPVGRFFAALRAPVVHYKCCSTFDSAPHVGSIGQAVRVLNRHIGSAWVPIVGGQPNIGRYCCFSQLFASAGAQGEVHRIDRHPTMSRHPVTPMGEADLRRHLQAQGLARVAALHYPAHAQTADAHDAALQQLLATQPDAVLMDISGPQDLGPVGRLIWRRAQEAPLLVVGPSGVVQALAAHWHGAANPAPALPAPTPVDSPVFAFAGSLSPQTAAQVAAATSFQKIPVDVRRLLEEPDYASACCDAVLAGLAARRHVLAHTESHTRHADLDAHAIASATGDLVASVVRARAASAVPLRRVGIAGGDTSSLAVQRLGLWGLACQGVLAPGVTLSRARSDAPSLDGLELMLKGGQMGPLDMFERLLHGTVP
ncbi:four-carbon acid sugar kinase family protein [Hydrogenophaga sp. BPS33]|uniref:four-carbon acid sugar kinase family protein n=1 Tax=Hydrogenophaga sp. BPS33 TaxID=2651974 RepID=UPI00131FD0CD|nr:four-carbon acid sugar kinase family protein [Hydrogenophaga sp. BPS33]QHE87285.1 four-carbon acid sugar kinase family protein [Hydrogenophaga sp. BPS33]